MEQDATNELGQHIKRLREDRGLNVRGLAAKAGLTGSAVSRVENGKRTPALDTLKAIASALDVPLTDMFAMSGYLGPYDLPSLTPYLHARYGHLPEASLTAIDTYLKRLIDEHGLDPQGPLGHEDEISESAER
jgi:transcriptional regulator with XRE-family HTH domain